MSLKDAVKLKHFGPPQPQVNMMVRFSRCLFAQLLRQEFHPPLSFGNHVKPAGEVGTRSSLEPTDCGNFASHHFSLLPVGPREYEAWLLGSKLAVGMEIGYADARARRLKRTAAVLVEGDSERAEIKYDFDKDEDWIAYKKRIHELGFFQVRIETIRKKSSAKK